MALAELPLVLSECVTVPIDDLLITEAISLVGSHALRSLDAIQLAGATSFFRLHALNYPSAFVPCDHKLIEAARANGVHTWNPESANKP